jgi:hypothetical protein
LNAPERGDRLAAFGSAFDRPIAEAACATRIERDGRGKSGIAAGGVGRRIDDRCERRRPSVRAAHHRDAAAIDERQRLQILQRVIGIAGALLRRDPGR